MGTALTAIVSALTSVMVTMASLFLGDHQRRRAELRAARQEINGRYLNPLRLHLVENHFRLASILRIIDAEGVNKAMLTVDTPEELSTKDAQWFNEEGSALVTSAYLSACLFAQLKQVRDDAPYLRLSGADDTRLAVLMLGVQQGYLQDGGVKYVTQPSIGEDLWVRPTGRLRTYREFCQILTDPQRRVWFDRLLNFHLETARGDKRERAEAVLAAIQALSEFLDECVGGGQSIGSRWEAEGVELT